MDYSLVPAARAVVRALWRTGQVPRARPKGRKPETEVRRRVEERSEVREEGAEGAVRDGVVPGRPPPPPPGFGVRDSVVCESLPCARAVRTVRESPLCLSCTPRVGVFAPVCDTPPATVAPFCLIFPFPACSFHALSSCNDSLLQIIIIICDSIS